MLPAQPGWRSEAATALREQVRSYGWENIVHGIFQDLRYTLRRLRATPGFTMVSIVTLALGLGATTAIFSVINGVLLKPLPYAHPEQLVSLWMTAPGVKIEDLHMAPSVYFTMADESRAFQAVSIWTSGTTSVTGKEPEQVSAVFASHELLPILGVKPQLGRLFAAADDDPKGTRTAMLSDGYWRSHFGGDRSVLGRRLLIEGNRVSIIGVLPPSFQFMDREGRPAYSTAVRPRQNKSRGVQYHGCRKAQARRNFKTSGCGSRPHAAFGIAGGFPRLRVTQPKCLKMRASHPI